MALTITEYDALDDDTGAEAWSLYEATFTQINELAAQRHLMTLDEFYAVARDKRIRKFIAHDGTLDRMVGLSTITNDLEAWPLISPPYFRKNWPDHYAREAVWYIGIVGVHPNWPGAHVFSALIKAMSPLVFESDGLAVMDFCAWNEDLRQMPRVTTALLKRLYPVGSNVQGERVDAQSTWVYRFDGQPV
jgi:hypothetical protein